MEGEKKQNINSDVKTDVKTNVKADEKMANGNIKDIQKKTHQPEGNNANLKSPPQGFVDEMGVISKDTKIIGDVSSCGHITVLGEVKGDVSSLGDIFSSGIIEGNVSCVNLKLAGSKMKTRLTVEKEVIIDEKAKVEGDIDCKTITINGIVEGDVVAKDHICLLENANIKGDLSAKSLDVNTGAQIQGSVMIIK